MLVELGLVEQRYRAVCEVLEGATVIDVARRNGVARQTVHDWLRAYASGGMAALVDRSSKPQSCPHQIPPAVEARIVELRRANPRWGPRTILSRLARVSDGVHAIAVGLDGLESLEVCETIRLVDDWDDVADDLVARAEQSHALLAANRWATAFTARARAGWRDDLAPVVVFFGEMPDDERFQHLSGLVATGATTLSVVVAADVPNATRLVLDGDLLHLPGLGITCRAQGVEAETVDRVVEVLTDADDLPSELPLVDELPGVVSLSDRAPDEAPEILVRVLGEIDVVGGRKPLTPKQTAVVAYIALHAPVAAERIEDAIWTEPTASRRKRMSNTVSDCRFSLGEEHLPFAQEGRYRVGPRVGTDIDLFERRVAYAADRPPAEAVPLLRQALELVRGPVFTYRSLDRSSYVWIDVENWMTTWELKVAEAALKLNELALELGDPDSALWAAERGLLALPTNSSLTEALMKAYCAAGDVGAADRVYERHLAALQQLGIDDAAETTIDLREEILTAPERATSS